MSRRNFVNVLFCAWWDYILQIVAFRGMRQCSGRQNVLQRSGYGTWRWCIRKNWGVMNWKGGFRGCKGLRALFDFTGYRLARRQNPSCDDVRFLGQLQSGAVARYGLVRWGIGGTTRLGREGDSTRIVIWNASGRGRTMTIDVAKWIRPRSGQNPVGIVGGNGERSRGSIGALM